MRSREFITERDGKIGTRRQAATRGLTVFGDAERANSDYTLNRVMMAAAMADGSGDVLDMDEKSWIGKKRGAYPYTEIEHEMLKQAFRAAGAEYTDLNAGDMESEEVPSTNTQSPVVAFKGYPR
jgi:ADP-ribose pyrophosphatase YjhB (NUDIX family)